MDDGEEHLLTTIDNPWNPWTNYDEWWQWDRAHGYDTRGCLARVVNTSFDLSESEQALAIEQAIDEICKLNVNGLYTNCLLYTSDAADDLLCVDLGGRRIIKKK